MSADLRFAKYLYPEVPDAVWAKLRRRSARFSDELGSKLSVRRRHRKVRAGFQKTADSNQN